MVNLYFFRWHLEELNPTSHQGGNWEGSNHRIYSGVLDVELMDEFGVNTYKTWVRRRISISSR